MNKIYLIMVVGIIMSFILGVLLAATAYDKQVEALSNELNQYIPFASDSREQYCERVLSRWQKTRDILKGREEK